MQAAPTLPPNSRSTWLTPVALAVRSSGVRATISTGMTE